jgi:hypothetical protein
MMSMMNETSRRLRRSGTSNQFAAIISMVALLASITAMRVDADVIVNWQKLNNSTGVDVGLNIGAASAVGNVQNWSGTLLDGTVTGYGNQPLQGILQTEGAAGTVDFEHAFLDGDANEDFRDTIWYGISGSAAGTGGGITGLFSVNSGDFLAGGVTATDTITSMVLTMADHRLADSATGTGATRFAVNSGGNWYVSSDHYSGHTTTQEVLTYTGADWAAFTPSNSGSSSMMTSDGLTYNVAGSSLNDIQAVGFLFEATVGSTAAGRARIRVADLAVTTTSVPEPATPWLMVAGLVGLVATRRRS